MLDPRALDERFEIVDLARRLANVVRTGTVTEVDLENYRLKARYDTGDDGEAITSAWMPWLVTRAGGDRSWWAPEEGEGVVLLAPGGELDQAIALPSLYSTAHAAPSDDPDKSIVTHSDGATMEYDRENHVYRIALPTGSRAQISAGTIVLSGATETWTIP